MLVPALFFVSTVNYADRTAITALYALLKTDLGFADVGPGALGSVFSVELCVLFAVRGGCSAAG